MNGRALNHPPLTQEIAPLSAVERLHEIDIPTLVMWGGRDFPHIVENSRWIAGQIAKAETMVMQDCAHLPVLERPDEFNGAVTAFLTKHG